MNDVINLVSQKVVLDDIGQEKYEDNFREVYARESGVPSSEFFAAKKQGMQEIKKFVIRNIDYNNELYFEYANKRYHIYRTYPISNEMVELYGEYKN